MARSKVDTKALEETNGHIGEQVTSDNVGGSEIFTMGLEAVELIVAAFGTNDRTAKALARQLCSSTYFLLHGSENYKGIKSYVMDAVTDVTEAEDKLAKDVAGAQGIHDRACERRDMREAEEKDIQALHDICCAVYETETGEQWEPYKPQPKKKAKLMSAKERLQAKGMWKAA